ncbi:MAG: DUF5915 domain-containing protein [Deltaproteobacteria bacterium]
MREAAGIKHRQPLRVARVGGLSDGMLGTYRALLAAELNVKAVERYDAVTRKQLVLDYGKLGKRLRGAVKAVAAAVVKGAYVENADGSLAVAGVRLEADEVTWRTAASSEPGVAARDGVVVALDLTLDAGLVREAAVRELAHAVQDLRKRAGLRYGEPVRLSVVGDAVVDEAALRAQCSVVAVSREALPEPLSSVTVELGAATVELALGR